MDRIERIEQKVDEVQKSISNIDVTLAEQHVSLKEHMRRTDLLERVMLIVLAAVVAAFLK